MQKERKERLTKREWYDAGGFANSELFRNQSRGGAWRYYRRIPTKDDIGRAFNAGIDDGLAEIRAARAAGRASVTT